MAAGVLWIQRGDDRSRRESTKEIRATWADRIFRSSLWELLELETVAWGTVIRPGELRASWIYYEKFLTDM
jgi:hypothetical protein